MKASVFRRWPVTAPYRGEQTTRWTGGPDFTKDDVLITEVEIDINVTKMLKIYRKCYKKMI